MKSLLQGLSHLVAPRVCRVCSQTLAKGEDALCLACLLDLPRTGAHLSDFNEIHQRLGHNAHVARAAGWFYYRRRSPYAQMLIDAKYAQLPRLARTLGRLCATELQACGFFSGIDALVPMPLHWLKRLSRGYNQAHEICLGVAQATGLPIIPALRAVKGHGVQSRNTRQGRYASIAGTLALNPRASIVGKHVLLVDDIITTGASAAEATTTLTTASPAAISILALGLTALE